MVQGLAEDRVPGPAGEIVAYFRDPKSGDIAAFAAPGWDFADENKSGHGGLRNLDMRVPLLIAGPGVPHTEVPENAHR